MRDVSRFCLRARILAVESSIWRVSLQWHLVDTVTSALVLLCRMRCIFRFTVKICLCDLSERHVRSIFSLSARPSLWRPLTLCMPCLVRLSLISFLNGKTTSAILFWTLWPILWLAKTSNKPINQPNDQAGN